MADSALVIFTGTRRDEYQERKNIVPIAAITDVYGDDDQTMITFLRSEHQNPITIFTKYKVEDVAKFWVDHLTERFGYMISFDEWNANRIK